MSKIPLKGSGAEKREGETKILKSGDTLVQGVDALKRVKTGTPLRTMVSIVRYRVSRSSDLLCICSFQRK